MPRRACTEDSEGYLIAFVFFELKLKSDPLKPKRLNRTLLKSADLRSSALVSRIVSEKRRNRGKLDAHRTALC